MAVIITDMEMPNSCADCPLCHCKGKDDPWNYSCFATMDDINIEEWDKQRYMTCPLKSVDGLIEKITAYAQAPNLSDKSGVEDGLLLAVRLIKEYCGGE